MHDLPDELAELISRLFHDLNAPIRGIENLSSWVKEDLEPLFSNLDSSEVKISAEARQSAFDNLRLLDQQLKQLKQLTSGVEDYIALRGIAFTPSSTNINETLERIAIDASELSISVSGGEVSITTNEKLFITLVKIILSNCVVHCGLLPVSLIIGVECEADNVVISFTDNGPGLEPNMLENIFLPFETLLPRTDRKGAGMGLAIAKRISEILGGTLTAALRENSTGTVFKLSLPA